MIVLSDEVKNLLKGQLVIDKIALALAISAALAGCANLDERGNEVVGGAVGGAAGAAIGGELGGRDGAIIGAGAGAAAGAAVGQRASGAPERVIVNDGVIYREKHRKHKRKHRDDDDDDDDDDRHRHRRHHGHDD